MNGIVTVPPIANETILSYAPGTPERAELKAELEAQATQIVDIPLIIGGEEIRTGDTFDMVMPHAHAHVIAKAHRAGPEEIERAVAAAGEAHRAWSTTPWEDRAAVFLNGADLLAGPWRAKLNAATMLGQSKTAFQAEVDVACELIDFIRFGTHYAERIYSIQPRSDPGIWNRSEYRALEGSVYEDGDWSETLRIVDSTSPYALTGAVFDRDRLAIREVTDALAQAAGNFYVNDKPTGAVVGHRPFGEARASGTNDKAGSMLNLLRWVSARSIKETFVPATDHRYPFMDET